MKLWAKVRFIGSKNAECLIRAFFAEFDPNNSISIRGKEAKMEIVFDNKPPQKIIEAVGHCDILELNYGCDLTRIEYGETQNEEGTSEQTEQETVEGETSEQTEQETVEKEKTENVVNDTKCDSKVSDTKRNQLVTIPLLDEVAENVVSFEEFIEVLANRMTFGKRKEIFKELAIVSTEVDKISWKNLEKALKNKHITLTTGDKLFISNHVSEVLHHSTTIIPLLKAIKEYSSYSFSLCSSEKAVEEEITMQNENEEERDSDSNNSVINEDDVSTLEETNEAETEQVEEECIDDTPKPRVRMNCMPEIREFEEILGSVDKTQPIEDRVRYVLDAMGLKKQTARDRELIFEIVNTAVRKGKISFDIIYVEAKIPMENAIKARMTLSAFINDFVQKYEKGKKVKVLRFLSDLQKIIMFDSEIENFADFTD